VRALLVFLMNEGTKNDLVMVYLRYDESSPEVPAETNDSFSVQLSASTKSTATASVPSGVHGNHTFCIVKDRLLTIK
jgi:hypothetical protein